MTLSHRMLFVFLFAALISPATAGLRAAEPTTAPAIKVVDSVVMPKRPVAQAIAEAMQFLKKADGGYTPGRIDGELAGHFTSAHVRPDGSRSNRKLAYPGRQHAYFIFTFLRYYAYTGEPEWLLRARDLADWNIAHSAPADAFYANLPYSTYKDDKPCGGADRDSLEPDKSAFLGSGYLAVYEATTESRYLDAARKVAETLVLRQRENGSWPFRAVPGDGRIQQDFGGAPVFFVEFFEQMIRHDDKPAYHTAHDRALKYMIQTHVEKNHWGTYHEDIIAKEDGYLSAEPMSFTADYLFRHAGEHPEYIEMGKKILGSMETKLVHTEGHAAAPAPAVSEQLGFNHMMPGHTARYCLALADLYVCNHDEQVKKRTLSGVNAVTYMQSPVGLFRTFFASVNKNTSTDKRPDWYSQHLYTVCHVLEIMSRLPELAPDGQDHILGSTTYVREVRYSAGHVQFEAIAPSRTVIKLSFVPKSVTVNKNELKPLEIRKVEEVGPGWCFDAASKTLTLRHNAGAVSIQ